MTMMIFGVYRHDDSSTELDLVRFLKRMHRGRTARAQNDPPWWMLIRRRRNSSSFRRWLEVRLRRHGLPRDQYVIWARRGFPWVQYWGEQVLLISLRS